jgi:hypothetical protein
MQKPSKENVKSAYRIFSYLSNTIDMGIVFRKEQKIILNVFVDAAFANNSDRKSQYGVTFRLGCNSGSFFSYSKKQSIITLSSTEAEYVAASEATKDILWFRSFFQELGYPQPSPTCLYEDNISCIKLTESANFNERTKHIDIRHHFLKEKVKYGIIKLIHLPTEFMISDLLTKSLPTPSFSRLRNVLLGAQIFSSE